MISKLLLVFFIFLLSGCAMDATEFNARKKYCTDLGMEALINRRTNNYVHSVICESNGNRFPSKVLIPDAVKKE